VGERLLSGAQQLLAVHGTSTKWSADATIDVPAYNGTLDGVSCHSQTTCVAVTGSMADQES
jgi:hypothetical protein